MTKRVLIGADPEVFLRSKSTGLMVSAAGLFPGSKENPYPLKNYGHVQVDGHALEFNTIPAETEDDFVSNVMSLFSAVKEMVEVVDPDLEVALDPVAEFDPDYFESLPLYSKILGCTPDFSMEDGSMLPGPEIGEVPIRTSSGHIHVGYTYGDDAFSDEVFADRLRMAQAITPHLLEVAKRWETPRSVERRKYYGGHGAFRPKHYGVELRALDCLWLESEDRMREVYRTAVDAFREAG